MKDLKIRVANEAESKEAQELFDALGYSKDAFENKSTPCWIAICDGFTYSDYNIGKSVWYTACPKEITLQELRDMVNPMKEYLEKQADGSYKLVMRGIVGKDGDIEVPEGADCARSTCSRLEFYKDNLNLFFSIRGDCWKNTISSRGVLSQNIVWQRHVQPEELPFIDDGPKIETATGYQLDVVGKNTYGSRSRESGESDTSYRQYLMNFKIDQSKSLNDQYAEIEQARKHRHYFKDVSNIAEIDVYAVLKLFDVTDPCLQHIVKKALCAGKRGHKDMMEDLQNIVDTAIRAVELNS